MLCRVLGKAIKTANVQKAMALGIAYLAKFFDGKQLFDECFFVGHLSKTLPSVELTLGEKKVRTIAQKW